MIKEQFEEIYLPFAEQAARDAMAGKPFWAWEGLTAETPDEEILEKARQITGRFLEDGTVRLRHPEITRPILDGLVFMMMAGWQAGYESKTRNRRP